MHKVYLSLGSNINAEQNIKNALSSLEQCFGSIEVSPIYESEALGFEGDNFLNLMVAIACEQDLSELIVELKTMEDQLGRVRGGPKFSPRVIDMDIVLFDDLCGEYAGIVLPRDELRKNAYVLLPLKDMAPELVDPESGLSMNELWENCSTEMTEQKLWLSGFQY